jgi:plasmid maintenance system killer protein
MRQKILSRSLIKKCVGVWLLIALLSCPLYAWANQFQLNGFWLHQYKKAVTASLGKPFQAGKTANSTWEAYTLSNNSHMIFEFLKDNPNFIYSIQITGDAAEMVPFMGLKLGDDKSQLFATLGRPDEIKRIESHNVDLYEYKDKNFSFEINDQGKIYSVRITEYRELFKSAPSGFSYWKDFKRTILNKDFKGLAEFFRPDAEIYINDEVLDIDRSFRSFFSRPAGKFYNALLGGEGSVFSELQGVEPQAELRITLSSGVGHVYKFYTGTILEEIIFFPYGGKYRIYEIKFRKRQEKSN